MRKLIRIAVAVAMLAAIALVAPGPASADHHEPGSPDKPNTSTNGTPPTTDPPDDGWHEKPPLPAVPTRAEECVVDGEIVAGEATAEGQDHLVPPAGNDARHSHYNFLTTTIECGGDELGVFADGGNDGHVLDIDGTCDENDVPPNVPDCVPGPSDLEHFHEFNGHHGSTNDSGWSHSSLYSGGPGGASSNNCDANSDENYNKGDISIPASESNGWVKYLRVGTVVYAWGCFFETSDAGIADNPFFGVLLVILPNRDAGPGNFPECLVPELGVPDPNDPSTTTTALTPPPPTCGFTIDGAGVRGPSWAVDTHDVHP